MRPEDVVGAVLRGVLLARPKTSTRTLRRLGHGNLLSTRNVLAAAAAAWGLYEAIQGTGVGSASQGAGTPASPPPAGPQPAPPLPTIGNAEAASAPPPLPTPKSASTGEAAFPPELVRLVRLLIAAARADGDLKPEEGALVARHAAEAGGETLVRAELANHPTLAEVVGEVRDAAAAVELYSLAFAVLRADEDVNADERRWLLDLQKRLGIDAPTARRVENGIAVGIDAGDAG